MSSWSFWDWLTYTCIGIAALVLALDQAIKGSPQLLGAFSGLLVKPSWNYAPLALIALSGVLLVLKQLNVLDPKGTNHHVEPAVSDEVGYIKTKVRLQFFGDQRIPHEVSSENVAVWFAYFSASLSITPMDANGKPIDGGMQIPPNWVIFVALDKPAKFRQAIVSFSNPEVMPIVDTHMANARVIAMSTRGQIPAGVLTIEVIE
ncbi:MAG: hypothetical protein KIS74_01180 [Burkholderiales bacterium]|nr:hypothetical protein [Burkholderiales bacterium]